MREFVTSIPILPRMLKDVCQVKGNTTRWKLDSTERKKPPEIVGKCKILHFFLLIIFLKPPDYLR